MATHTKLRGTDTVSDKLLHDIAHHVVYTHMRNIAYDAGIPEVNVSRIQYDKKSSVSQIFAVLYTWKERSLALTTQQVVAQVQQWQLNGYIDPTVWQSIQQLVDFPVPPPVAGYTASHTSSRKSNQMTDLHLLKLAQRITNDTDLRRLGIEVLGLEAHTVEAARYDSHREICGAAHDVIQNWKRRQVDLNRAYHELCASLIQNDMGLLAADLKQWVEGQ